MPKEELSSLSDEELIQRFREQKSEATGPDPELVPPDRGNADAVRVEMERRGISPDREDVIPDEDSPQEDPVVEDRA